MSIKWFCSLMLISEREDELFLENLAIEKDGLDPRELIKKVKETLKEEYKDKIEDVSSKRIE